MITYTFGPGHLPSVKLCETPTLSTQRNYSLKKSMTLLKIFFFLNQDLCSSKWGHVTKSKIKEAIENLLDKLQNKIKTLAEEDEILSSIKCFQYCQQTDKLNASETAGPGSAKDPNKAQISATNTEQTRIKHLQGYTSTKI